MEKGKIDNKINIEENNFEQTKNVSLKNQVMPNEVVAGGSCWYCKEFEQHTNQRLGHCHKHKFDAKARIAKLIKCEDFIHYNDKSQREA